MKQMIRLLAEATIKDNQRKMLSFSPNRVSRFINRLEEEVRQPVRVVHRTPAYLELEVADIKISATKETGVLEVFCAASFNLV